MSLPFPASILEYTCTVRCYSGYMQVHLYIHVIKTAILCQQSGMTPLHRAASQGNSDVVKALIKAGSKVDEKEKASII